MLTEQLSDFLYEVRYDSLPSKAVDNAKLYLGDLLGVAAAGSVQPQGGIWRSYFAAGDGQQEATAWNSGLERFSCEHAAALNAACAHVMDMDDVHNASITHLGAVTIPAALAVGQKLHRSGPLPRATRLAHGWGRPSTQAPTTTGIPLEWWGRSALPWRRAS